METILPVSHDIFSDIGNTRSIVLHEYQVEAANLALKERYGIIKCATGGGKTLMFAAIVKVLKKEYPVVILMRSKSLVEQTFNTLISCGITDVSTLTGDHAFYPSHVIISTVQSVNKLKSIFDKVKVLILDEVHQFSSTGSVKTLKLFPNLLMKLGFSATPWKVDDDVNYFSLLLHFLFCFCFPLLL
eukprot:TRINITY_DN4056_c0_g1_i8.p1 TRINITY_DN4056_c0_g1~~TRINITY_DN4056_c0_g1_i8.p1  ORF type:complete len:187 (+),score=38.11 TRINITY_DN4056_c0_g1_i8:328-888(+)